MSDPPPNVPRQASLPPAIQDGCSRTRSASLNRVAGRPDRSPAIRALRARRRQADILARVGELLKLLGLHPDDGVNTPTSSPAASAKRVAIARRSPYERGVPGLDEPTSA